MTGSDGRGELAVSRLIAEGIDPVLNFDQIIDGDLDGLQVGF